MTINLLPPGTALFRTYNEALAAAKAKHGDAWHNCCQILPAYHDRRAVQHQRYFVKLVGPRSAPIL